MTSPILVFAPPHRSDPRLPLASARAGAVGILTLSPGVATADLSLLRRKGEGRWGAALPEAPAAESLALLEGAGVTPEQPVPWLVIPARGAAGAADLCRSLRPLGHRMILEVCGLEDLGALQEIEADGVILKTLEAGGTVGPESAFMVLQRFPADGARPWWVRGAWGPDTAAAAQIAGAGIALCEELWLAREAPFDSAERRRFAALDGSETVCEPGEDGRLSRVHTRDPDLPLGQGIAFARRLAATHVTTGRILGAFRESMASLPGRAARLASLAPGAPLAASVGSRVPVLQGPMTRVSDTVPFCRAVAEGGGLPFLALALMEEDEVRTLVEATHAAMGDLPWGVGILGFVPPELRKRQLAAIGATPPPFAVIAGGRPSQARELAKAGIESYLHVPSPGLLARFLEDGARRFIFEGRECGGHVGPRPAMTLWQSAVDVLLEADIRDPENVHVVLAGGIHDDLSAAIVQTLSARLAERGMKIGVLMGTAYLFTREAVSAGAITPAYQDQALACEKTVLLESGVGHATRCASSPFADEFQGRRAEMKAAGADPDRIRFELEMLNVGRLRLASKGLARKEEDPSAKKEAATRRIEAEGGAVRREELLERGRDLLRSKLVSVDAETQRSQGMFMIGDVATLRRRVVDIAELHAGVTEGAQARLAGFAAAQREEPSDATLPVTTSREGIAARASAEPVAIVGMACIFPESPDLRTFWRNIIESFDAVKEVPASRWPADLYFSEDRFAADRIYSKWGSFLDPVRFDPLEWRIPPASLRSIEPVQILALMVARRALEDAGYHRRPFPRERTAVIFGSGGVHDSGIDFAMRTVLPQYLQRVESLSDSQRESIVAEMRDTLPPWTEDSFPGSLLNVISGRVANALDLQGANFVVDAACASSLAAMHAGVQQLRSGTCDMALVGAADATNHAFAFMNFAKTHALTPGGKIRPFDQRADGIVLGEGIGAVILKRLADAERDGDRVYAVVRGVGSSSDGHHKSLTAPHPGGQALAIQRAYDDAQVEPRSVQLVEAHATGTAVGDRSELAAMQQVFPAGEGGAYCAVGSVKSMIGHAKTAAGMAGLIKSALALNQKTLPPTINVEEPNTALLQDGTPFFLNTRTRPWIRAGQEPRRAGVSAFGFGGTNFHVVLEEYEPVLPGDAADLSPRPAEPFAWRRPDWSSLAAHLEELRRSIAGCAAPPPLASLARACRRDEADRRVNGGGEAGVRLALLATSVPDLLDKLSGSATAAGRPNPGWPEGVEGSDEAPLKREQVCFLFPGQGAQRVNMMQDLVGHGPFGTGLFEEADRLLADLLPRPLSSYIFPLPASGRDEEKAQASELTDTRIAQPAIGVMDLFAADVLRHFGIQPALNAGHSYGEFVALADAGLTPRADLLRLSALRGLAVHEAARGAPGTMLAVAADEAATRAALEEIGSEASIANLNAPNQTIIGGTHAAIDDAQEKLAARGLACRKVPVSAAFHTAAMKGPAEAMGEHLARVELAPLRIPVYSNVTAEPYPDDLDAVRRQLTTNLALPVRFVEQIRAMHDAGARLFLEVGPGRILTGLVRRILADAPHVALSIDHAGQPGWLSLGRLLTRCHALGLPVRWDGWFERREIEDRTLQDLLNEAEARAPRPTDWLIAAEGSRPLHAPHRSESTRTASKETTRPAAPPRADTERKDPMTEKPPLPPLLAHLQETMNKWLDLQREQQRLNERFLGIHERLVTGLVGEPSAAGVQTGPSRAVIAGPGQAAVAPSPGAPTTVAVPPAPVLPDLPPVTGVPAANPSIHSGNGAPGIATPTAAATTSNGSPASEGNGALPTVEAFQRDLVGEVSRRTGYPEDMLDLDTPLEAGLGIDSIKTMEIFSALKKYHAILSDNDQDEEEVLVQLSQMKTLRDIIEHFRGRSARMGAPRPVEPETTRPFERGERAPVERWTLRSRLAPLTANGDVAELPSFPRGDGILLLGEAAELGTGIEATLSSAGYRVFRLTQGSRARKIGAQHFQCDLGAPESIRQAGDWLRRAGRVGCVINLLALPPESGPDIDALGLVQRLTRVMQALETDLTASAAEGGGWLVNLTALDGRFGVSARGDLAVEQAGSLGFFKSLGREWRGVQVRNIDLDPEEPVESRALRVVQELAATGAPVEVGLDGSGRWLLELVPSPLDDKNGSPAPPLLDAGSVVLITGGGHGITADVVRRIARDTPARLVLVGRTPDPEHGTEADELTELTDETALRAALLDLERRRDGAVTPAQVEQRLQGILRRRALSVHLALLRRTAEVEYHAVDVRDDGAFGRLIEEIYSRLGRIDAVIHGAGVIEDGPLRSKTPDSVARVFETKVNGALTLARHLRPEKLRFLAFFSSLSGRLGNANQTDYAAANEMLNKLAAHLDHAWPGRVVAVNWGPWDAGMLSPVLREAYRRRGVDLIGVDDGVDAFLREISHRTADTPEVVLACSPAKLMEAASR